MWIGSIRLDVLTKDAPKAGTDNLVTVRVERNGHGLLTLRLDHPTENDLQRGVERGYFYRNLPWINDQTPELPPHVAESPPPYPPHGIEFSHGLRGHLILRLRIHGDDRWVKDEVDLFVREIRFKATSFDTEDWFEDTTWTHVTSWTRNVALSTDSSEGVSTWNLMV